MSVQNSTDTESGIPQCTDVEKDAPKCNYCIRCDSEPKTCEPKCKSRDPKPRDPEPSDPDPRNSKLSDP